MLGWLGLVWITCVCSTLNQLRRPSYQQKSKKASFKPGSLVLAVCWGASVPFQVTSLSKWALWSKMAWISLHDDWVLKVKVEAVRPTKDLGCKISEHRFYYIHLNQSKPQGQSRVNG